MIKFNEYLPLDPGEIEHVLYELRRDFSTEYRDEIIAGTMRSYGIAPKIQGALLARATQRASVGSRPPRSIKDWASLTASDDDFLAAIATAWYCLYWFQESWKAGRGDDDPPIEDDPDWERLRSALIEIAHWIISAEYIDSEKWSARAEALERENARLRPLARRGKQFASGRRRGSLASHRQVIAELLQDHPDLPTREILRKLKDVASQSDDCPIALDDDDLYLRRTGKSIPDPVNLIDKVRASLKSAIGR